MKAVSVVAAMWILLGAVGATAAPGRLARLQAPASAGWERTYANPHQVTPDGSAVVGSTREIDFDGSSRRHVTRWNAEGELVARIESGMSVHYSSSISMDGTIVGGTIANVSGTYPLSALWARDEGIDSVPFGGHPAVGEPSLWSHGTAMSRDGNIIYGQAVFDSLTPRPGFVAYPFTFDSYRYSMTDSYRYDRRSGETWWLGSPPDPYNAFVVLDTTSDGSVAMGAYRRWGSSERIATRWTAERGFEEMGILGPLPLNLTGRFLPGVSDLISDDGSTIVAFTEWEKDACLQRFTEEEGFRPLTGPDLCAIGVYGISADGSKILGVAGRSGSNQPPACDYPHQLPGYVLPKYVDKDEVCRFLWDRTQGFRWLEDVLRDDYGIDFSAIVNGWDTIHVTSFSADGRTLLLRAFGSKGEDQYDQGNWLILPPTRCDDGLDNDGDGLGDYPEDPGCHSLDDDTEDQREDIAIDIKPHEDPNTIFLDTVVPVSVAIMGSETVDITQLGPGALGFGPSSAESIFDLSHPIIRLLSLRDVNRDGFLDLLVFFSPQDAGIGFGDEEACLTGELDGDPFEACDSVVVRYSWCGPGFELALVLPLAVWIRRRHAPRRARG